VTADQRAALGATWCVTRFAATSSACERGLGEAVAHYHWEAVGVLAQTPPPQRLG